MNVAINANSLANEVSGLLKDPEKLDEVREALLAHLGQEMSDFDVAFDIASRKHHLTGDLFPLKQEIGRILGRRPKRRKTTKSSSKKPVRVMSVEVVSAIPPRLVLCVDGRYTIILHGAGNGKAQITSFSGQGQVPDSAKDRALQFAESCWAIPASSDEKGARQLPLS